MSAPRDQPDFVVPTILLSAETIAITVPVPANDQTDAVTINGTGYVDCIILYIQAAVGSNALILEVFCDGQLALQWDPQTLSAVLSFTATTLPFMVLIYNVGGICCICSVQKLSFKTQCIIRLRNPTATGQVATVYEFDSVTR